MRSSSSNATILSPIPGKAVSIVRAVILCLGETLVDLISEKRVRSFDEVDCFRPYFGGALANVAVAARRTGAEAGLASGVGDDDWGRWVRDRLVREGVDLRHFHLLEGESTPLALATFDATGEPTFRIYGDAVSAAVESVEDGLPEGVDTASALVYGSTTLATPGERRVTLRARELSLQRGVRVCFDPNFRPARWGDDLGAAVRVSRELIDGSYLVRANRSEAAAVADRADPREAAQRIVDMGATLAVVTLGEEGAVIRGACEAEAPAPTVEVVSTLGAGDAFLGTLLGGLSARGWDPSRAGEALGPALAAAAEACTRWSALD
jgi:sugar/nucleoside kinase (ribokinase family)